MQVCIIDTERNRPERYQVMENVGTAFLHLCPGKLFTLADAENYCREKGYQVKAIGTMWQCLNA